MTDKRNHAYVIAIGNEKGGSGKTTTSMHLVVALIRMGFSVASFDLDCRQRSLTRYLDNRRAWAEANGVDLPMPDHTVIERSGKADIAEAAEDEHLRLEEAIAGARAAHDFIVIDCPGSDAPLSRRAHFLADTLITPLNDSLVDLDVLVEIDPATHRFRSLGVYAEMILEQRRERLKAKRGGVDWVIMRNRLSALADRNKRNLADILAKLSKAFGFRLTQGFGERVIFRQLFLDGLTVLDLRDAGLADQMSMSHIAARQEVRGLLTALWLPRVSDRLEAI